MLQLEAKVRQLGALEASAGDLRRGMKQQELELDSAKHARALAGDRAASLEGTLQALQEQASPPNPLLRQVAQRDAALDRLQKELHDARTQAINSTAPGDLFEAEMALDASKSTASQLRSNLEACRVSLEHETRQRQAAAKQVLALQSEVDGLALGQDSNQQQANQQQTMMQRLMKEGHVKDNEINTLLAQARKP